MIKNIFVLIIFFTCLSLSAQKVNIVNQEKKEVSFRGLYAIDQAVFWVSGSHGTVGMTYNGGKNFKWVNPGGYENRDFRDIEILNNKTLLVMAVGTPGIILKSSNNGKTWREVYRDENPEVFLDAMDFSPTNPNNGIVVGDPMDGLPYILETTDAGETWNRVLSPINYPSLKEGEAFFAASGSNIQMINDSVSLLATGGTHSNFIVNTTPFFQKYLPKINESTTAGANGLEYSALENYGLIAGGDFTNPNDSENNLIIFELDEKNKPVFSKPKVAPEGYKSDVAIIGNSKAVACGISGIDFSEDKGKNWIKISNAEFHVCEKSTIGNKVFFAGPNGKIGVLEF